MRSLPRLVPALAVSLLLAGCGGSPTGPGEPPPEPSDPRVNVTPGSYTLASIDASRDFDANLVDASGDERPDSQASWASTDPSVASVNGQGVAVARAEGTTAIIATFRGVADTAQLTVDPEVASVAVSPGRDSVASSGGTADFDAEATDANGHSVADAPVSWHSSDTTVAVVDAQGTATGRASGQADIVASANGHADTARLVVTATPANQRPSVTIEQPGDGASVASDSTVTFSGSASDPEDGALTGSALTWRSDLDGTLGHGEIVSTSSLSAGTHQITLTATDSEGAEASDRIVLTVEGAVNLVLADLRLVRRGVLTSEAPEVSAVIRNDGAQNAGPFEWRVLVDGSPVAQGQVGGIAAADSVVTDATSIGTVAAGYHWVRFEVDPTDAVAESRESDNAGRDRLRAYTGGDGFTIELDYLSSVSGEQRQAFDQAAARWGEVITSDLPDATFSTPEDFEFCTEGAGERSERIDDLLIFVTVDSIDGRGGTLGQARPCLVRTDPANGHFRTAVVGEMTFDEDDLASLSSDMLEDLILHEMGHVLGIGVLWDAHELIRDKGSDDPVFTGAAGRRGFLAVGGDDYDGRPVPAANTGGTGTRDVHWRESVFEHELMTGFISSGGGNPLSRVTVQSLGDQFYGVSLGAADPYSLPSGAAIRLNGASPRLELGDDIGEGEVRGLDPSGRITRILHLNGDTRLR